jgi:hypothetical protein
MSRRLQPKADDPDMKQNSEVVHTEPYETDGVTYQI